MATFQEKLASKLSAMGVAPGNDCPRISRQLVEWMKTEDDAEAQIHKDDLDIEALHKDVKAIMTSIVAMSKLLEKTTTTGGNGESTVRGDTEETTTGTTEGQD